MMESLTQIAAPSGDVVTLADLKSHVRVDGTAEDDVLTAFLNAATEYAGTMRGEQLLTATWKYSVTAPDHVDEHIRHVYGLPSDVYSWIRLPFPPLASITNIKYYDENNSLQTLDPSLYRLINGVGKAAYVVFPTSTTVTQPKLYKREDALQVTFASGYGDASKVPETIKIAIKLLAAHWYKNREATTPGVLLPVPYGIDVLLGLDATGRRF